MYSPVAGAVLLCAAFVSISRVAGDRYDENLVITPMSDGQVYTHFEFKTVWDQDLRDLNWASHYDLFPMALGKFIAQHELQELHFSLTKGLWKHKLWGYPVRDAHPGAELWAWFQPFHKNPVQGWKEVTGLLSGQFCASLNFIDKSATVQPRISLRPEGVVRNSSDLSNHSVFYAALPHEAVCTENLTPWKKLLPCFSRSGLASLLNAGHLFNTNYFSLALDLRPVCRDASCKESSLELTQSISVVFNLPALFDGKQSWSLFKLFGSSLRDRCRLASSAKIYVDITHNATANSHVLQPEPNSVLQHGNADGQEARKYAVYDINRMFELEKTDAVAEAPKQLNIASQYKKDHSYWLTQSPALFATRFVSGYGVSQGGIVTRITNKLTEPVQIVYMDVIPWYLRIYMHTLRLSSGEQVLKPDLLVYKPAKDRNQPHHIELVITLPARAVTELRIDFDRSYLKWTEYPPDANHGVYVGSALISSTLRTSRNITRIPSDDELEAGAARFFIRLHTESLLVSLPTPDFSMPYNVICLVSTVVSLAFGPIHNLTTRNARIVDESAEAQSVGLVARLKNKLRSLFKKDVPVEGEAARVDEVQEVVGGDVE